MNVGPPLVGKIADEVVVGHPEDEAVRDVDRRPGSVRDGRHGVPERRGLPTLHLERRVRRRDLDVRQDRSLRAPFAVPAVFAAGQDEHPAVMEHAHGGGIFRPTSQPLPPPAFDELHTRRPQSHRRPQAPQPARGARRRGEVRSILIIPAKTGPACALSAESRRASRFSRDKRAIHPNGLSEKVRSHRMWASPCALFNDSGARPRADAKGPRSAPSRAAACSRRPAMETGSRPSRRDRGRRAPIHLDRSPCRGDRSLAGGS